jgi:hypothetical protein
MFRMQSPAVSMVSGQLPASDGRITITGKLGAGVSIERGKEAYGSASSACWRS